jgi:hypothetical protein
MINYPSLQVLHAGSCLTKFLSAYVIHMHIVHIYIAPSVATHMYLYNAQLLVYSKIKLLNFQITFINAQLQSHFAL